jgi:hypothetical protein
VIYLPARIVAVAVAVVVWGSPLVARAVTFSDGEFLNANWSGSIVAQTGVTPATLTAGQVLSGGNPGAFRRVEHAYGGAGSGSIISGHVFSSVYDPATQGAIGSVQFELDLNLFNGGESNGVAFGALLTQGMSVYLAGHVLKCEPEGASNPSCVSTTLNVWTEHDLGPFVAASFLNATGIGPALPDFSATGLPIQFGFYASNGTGGPNRTATNSGVDNWSVDINPAAVPEPGTLLLIAVAGGLTIVLTRRRRE